MHPDGRAVVAAAIALSLACGHSVTAPSSTLQFGSATYTFTTILDKDWCVATGQAPATALSVRSIPKPDGPDWTFRSLDQPDSTFEFRITGTATGATWQVNGFVRGNLMASAVAAVTADFGTLGVIAGVTDAQVASGQIHGQVKFADAAGNALTCTNVRWAFLRN
jgi:hypothetical protein